MKKIDDRLSNGMRLAIEEAKDWERRYYASVRACSLVDRERIRAIDDLNDLLEAGTRVREALSKAHARNVLLQDEVDELEDKVSGLEKKFGTLKVATCNLIYHIDLCCGVDPFNPATAFSSRITGPMPDLGVARNEAGDLVGYKRATVIS